MKCVYEELSEQECKMCIRDRPTAHPHFAGIIEDTLALRDKYFPQAKVDVYKRQL